MSDNVQCVDRSIHGRCWWKDCRRPLPKYKRHYCSNRCASLFAMNHTWSSARAWAIRFAQGMCERCKKVRAGYETPIMYPHRIVEGLELEVNHIVPLNGSARTETCANHQMNLEVLCHECHAGVTAQQARDRSLARRINWIDSWEVVNPKTDLVGVS